MFGLAPVGSPANSALVFNSSSSTRFMAAENVWGPIRTHRRPFRLKRSLFRRECQMGRISVLSPPPLSRRSRTRDPTSSAQPERSATERKPRSAVTWDHPAPRSWRPERCKLATPQARKEGSTRRGEWLGGTTRPLPIIHTARFGKPGRTSETERRGGCHEEGLKM